MENDNRFTLDARLRDLVVCLSGTDMSDDAIITVCLDLQGHPSACSRLMTYLESGERSGADVVSEIRNLLKDGINQVNNNLTKYNQLNS